MIVQKKSGNLLKAPRISSITHLTEHYKSGDDE